jgi:hypothetical protein
MRAAPTVPFTLPRQTPQELLRKLLANLGDRSLISGRATGDQDWTYLHLRARGFLRARAEWEKTIVTGAFRDLLCAARAPLLWKSSDQNYPYLQRFPSPPERVFRRRLATAARRWHFRVLDARYLRPLQGAPMVVVQTQHPVRLARVAGKIRQFLDPVRPNRKYELGAWTYEGFYFEVEDAHNRAAFGFANAARGTGEGSQWARCERLYPFDHSGGRIKDGRPCT